MTTTARRPDLSRGIPPDKMRPFTTGITADGPGQVPHTCLCTWVPRHGVYHLKFPNHDCPVLNHTR